MYLGNTEALEGQVKNLNEVIKEKDIIISTFEKHFEEIENKIKEQTIQLEKIKTESDEVILQQKR